MTDAARSTVLVLGARSDIGRALARRYAAAGRPVCLAARRAAELEDDRADIALRYAVPCSTAEFDVLDPDPDAFFDRLGAMPDTVIMVAGLLGDQARSARDSAEAQRVMQTNYNGPALFCLAAARRMAARRSGTIIGISSVAGDRGRGSNGVYGSGKAGFTALLSGLRNAMNSEGVHVLTVKPGFVATQMTAGMKLPPRLTASAAEVAEAIFRADGKRRNTLYVKPIWRLVMTVIVLIPERVFKTLRL